MEKYNIWPPLYLKVLVHVLINHFDFAVKSLIELVDDQVRIVSTKGIAKHQNCEADWAL